MAPEGVMAAVGESPATVNYFSYDALQRRFAVQEVSGLSYFTWDQNGMNLLCERDASGSVTAYYTHGYTPVDGIGSLVAAKRNEAGASYYQYPVYDHRGSVVRLLDENGTPTAYFEYDAWGNQLKDQVLSGTATNRFRYQSNWIELKDSGGDLYLSPTRVYHARVGRFLGRDVALGLDGDGDYCEAEPVGCADPDGVGTRETTKGKRGGTGGGKTAKKTVKHIKSTKKKRTISREKQLAPKGSIERIAQVHLLTVVHHWGPTKVYGKVEDVPFTVPVDVIYHRTPTSTDVSFVPTSAEYREALAAARKKYGSGPAQKKGGKTVILSCHGVQVEFPESVL